MKYKLCDLLIMLVASSIYFSVGSVVADGSEIKKPNIEGREKWANYDPVKSRFSPMGEINHISVHQSEESKLRNGGTAKTELNTILYGHLKDNTWADIAYHYLIAPDGTIYEGRPLSHAADSSERYLSEYQWKKTGLNSAKETKRNPKDFPLGGTKGLGKEHTGKAPGYSAGHITVCFLGDFKNEAPTKDAKSSFLNLTEYLLRKHTLNVSDIWMHREVASSDCPGDQVYLWLRNPSKGRYALGSGLNTLKKRMK